MNQSKPISGQSASKWGHINRNKSVVNKSFVQQQTRLNNGEVKVPARESQRNLLRLIHIKPFISSRP